MPRSTISKSSEKKHNIPSPRHAPSPLNVPLPSQPPSMVDSMKQGFGFGIGNAIAHNLFRTNNKDEGLKKSDITTEAKLTNDKIYELYNKCLEKNDNNIDCTTILQNNK